jgi:hypothetical protein
MKRSGSRHEPIQKMIPDDPAFIKHIELCMCMA